MAVIETNETGQVVSALRAAASALLGQPIQAGTVKYPPKMVGQIMGHVEESLAGGILWFLERELPGLEAELAVFDPKAETRAPEPKVSGAMKKLARTALEDVVDLIERHQSGDLEDRGDDAERLRDFVTGLYGTGNRMFRSPVSLDKLKHREVLQNIRGALKHKKFDPMTDEEVDVFAAALYLASSNRKYKYSNAAGKSERVLQKYLKQRADIKTKQAGGDVRLGSWDEQDRKDLERRAKGQRELYDYLKGKGYKKTKYKPGPKREVKFEIPVDLSGVPDKYPTEAFDQGHYGTILLRIMPARASFGGSWSHKNRELMIVLGNYPMSMQGLKGALRNSESTVKHELEHMVQYIIKDSLKLRQGIGPHERSVRGPWGQAGTPFKGPAQPKTALGRDLQLQEKYPKADKDERYYLSPIEFFPQVGSAVNRFLIDRFEPMFGEPDPIEEVVENLPSLWKKYAGASGGTSDDPFFRAYKKHNPKMWRRAVSEGWKKLQRRIRQEQARR